MRLKTIKRKRGVAELGTRGTPREQSLIYNNWRNVFVVVAHRLVLLKSGKWSNSMSSRIRRMPARKVGHQHIERTEAAEVCS